MEKLTGRKNEKKRLLNALLTNKSELISVIGRRRVGKTFLIRNVYKDKIVFELSGQHKAPMRIQLKNFSNAMKEYSVKGMANKIPDDWSDAFEILKEHIKSSRRKGKKVIFLDEFPWIETPRSGFLSSFEHFWNSWASKMDDLIIVICGSSASWMIKKIVKNKGGLHNRITDNIRLMPFSLYETELFLKERNVNLDRYQISQLYMVMGGIPYYLSSIESGESAAMYINRMYFRKDGLLTGEFKNLYESLFNKAEKHIEVIRILARQPEGMTRDDLADKTGSISGGRFTETLSELEESGFIASYLPFGKRSANKVYKLIDEFSFFYLKFGEHSIFSGEDYWLKISSGYNWKIWSGFAFERLCLRHSDQIREALGISGVLANTGIWRQKGDKVTPGAQIDLFIDRQDNCINICELKYYESEFVLERKYAMILKNKIDQFRTSTKTKKTLFLTFITLNGLKQNQFSTGLVQNSLTIESLFSP